ncbi:S49 family peptidase [Hoeflea sp.]|uniref:S49 family peptidase n=1 Tax=Hoeflea sp. TaxID=1940281 RepID=UPI003B52B718
MRILDAGASVPWAIVPSKLEEMIEIADRTTDIAPETLAAYRAEQADKGERLQIRDDVAILNVEGPLFKKANLFTAMSGATSYEMLRRDLQVALDDPSISGILLSVSSPGGEAFGCDELAQAIFAARNVKPIHAFVSGQACSGGYWVASAASKVTVSDIAMLGSIGVVMGLEKRTNDAARGVERFEFVSSQSPGKRPDPSSDDGKAQIQKTVDDMAAVFVSAVAKHRGVSIDDVVKKFGAGGVEIGANAVSAGMADAVGQFEEALGALSKRGQTGRSKSRSNGGFSMSNSNKGPATTSDADTTAPDAAAEAAAKAAADARVETQARIKGILASDEGKKKPQLAEHLAYETDMDVSSAKAILAKAIADDPAASATPPAGGQQEQETYQQRKERTGASDLGVSDDVGGQPKADWSLAVSAANQRFEQ